MKRYVALIFALTFMLILCGCGAAPEAPTEPVVTELPTEEPTYVETIPDDLIDEEEYRTLTSYFVTVLDEKGQPVVGAMVRLGDSEDACITDETGVAQFSMPAGTYVATIDELPMGYEFATDYREFPFEADDVTLVIQVRQTFSEPDDLGMIDENAPIEEIYDEDVLIEE